MIRAVMNSNPIGSRARHPFRCRLFAAVVLGAATLLVGCRGSGALIGAGVGAVAGQAAGGDTESTVAGAVGGAAVGAAIESSYYGGNHQSDR